jgi:hypothetical protein
MLTSIPFNLHSIVSIPILIIKETIIKHDNKKDPPADINGKGRPFTGINPVDIAVFTNT